jgi:diguanylate cyclase (GGDEF)-like protein/PAS domain S-box-containing protein
MHEIDLEKKYKDRANRMVWFCIVAFCSVRGLAELIARNYDAAIKIAVGACAVVVLFALLQRRQFKALPFIVPFAMYLIYLGTSFTMGSFKYYYDFYLLILIICVTYFSTRNFLVLLVVTQIANLLLSIFVLPDHTSGTAWVHFVLTLGAGIMLLMVLQFAVGKTNAINRAFASFGALMKITPNVLILIDNNNKIKYLSQSVYKVFGIERPDELIGKNFLELFNEYSVSEIFGEIAKKRSFYENHHKVNIKGAIKTFDVFADKMSDHEGDGMFFMLNDITEIVNLKEIAEQDSLMDGLIQIPNRRAFDRQVVQEWNRALRERVNLSFLMIDIDFFKKYNDTYGHRQGDELLKAAGKVFNGNLKRSTDFIARLGGEEFGVLLYATNSYQANVIAERMRRSVENEVILTTTGQPTNFTISIGICTIVPHKGLEYSYIIEKADKALYKAKENGRNKVWVAD